MANTFTLIASASVGAGGAASIDFTSIPNTYNNLVVNVFARSVRGQTQDGMNMKLNTSASSFSGISLSTIGGIVQSNSFTNGCGSIPAANATGGVFSSTSIYLPNYTSSTSKTYSVQSVRENISNTVFEIDVIAGVWSSSSVINAISFYNDNANFAQLTTAYLYGIKNS
jgi:hypothetical protein